jgi:hypothetical protein
MRHRHRSPKLRLDGLATAVPALFRHQGDHSMTNATTNCIIVAKGEAAMPIGTIIAGGYSLPHFKFKNASTPCG